MRSGVAAPRAKAQGTKTLLYETHQRTTGERVVGMARPAAVDTGQTAALASTAAKPVGVLEYILEPLPHVELAPVGVIEVADGIGLYGPFQANLLGFEAVVVGDGRCTVKLDWFFTIC